MNNPPQQVKIESRLSGNKNQPKQQQPNNERVGSQIIDNNKKTEPESAVKKDDVDMRPPS